MRTSAAGMLNFPFFLDETEKTEIEFFCPCKGSKCDFGYIIFYLRSFSVILLRKLVSDSKRCFFAFYFSSFSSTALKKLPVCCLSVNNFS